MGQVSQRDSKDTCGATATIVGLVVTCRKEPHYPTAHRAAVRGIGMRGADHPGLNTDDVKFVDGFIEWHVE